MFHYFIFVGCLIFSDLDLCGKVKQILIGWIGKFIVLIGLLYLFICSLGFLSDAFRLLGGKTAGSVFNDSALLSNPITGLMIGILATVLVQSSSTSTSIVVTMVASGIIEVRPAIPIIMGANIGTSVTNTLVSIAQSGNRRQFRRAFAGATVHDMFNWLTVIILLPLEVATGYLYRLTCLVVQACNLQTFKGGNQDLLKKLTKPFTKLVIQIDKKVIEKIASGHSEYADKSLIKKFCVFEKVVTTQNATVQQNVSSVVDGTETFVLKNMTDEVDVTEKIGVERCGALFSQFDLSDTAAGIILLVVSLTILCTCLVLVVKLLNSMLKGAIAKAIRRTINADFPGCLRHLTGYVAILIGAIMTILVQSSSVFTSTLTPLVGLGLIKIERMYPLTLGSNIGTTMTGVLAALAAPGEKIDIALQIALCHLFFNISGIVLFYPVPVLRRMPIRAAKFLGSTTSRYRWFAVFYLISMFLLLPAFVFALSLAGKIAFISVGSAIFLLITMIILLNLLQKKRPKVLPKRLKTWEFLPLCLRSLEPYDRIVMSVFRCCPSCCCKAIKNKPIDDQESINRNVRRLDHSPGASTVNSLAVLINENKISVV